MVPVILHRSVVVPSPSCHRGLAVPYTLHSPYQDNLKVQKSGGLSKRDEGSCRTKDGNSSRRIMGAISGLRSKR